MKLLLQLVMHISARSNGDCSGTARFWLNVALHGRDWHCFSSESGHWLTGQLGSRRQTLTLFQRRLPVCSAPVRCHCATAVFPSLCTCSPCSFSLSFLTSLCTPQEAVVQNEPLFMKRFLIFFCIKVTDSNLHCSPVIKSFVCRRLKWSLVTSFGLCLPSKGAYLPIDYDKIRIAIQIYQAVTLRHTLVINRIKRWLNLPTGTWYHGHGALSYSRLRLHVAPGAKTHPTHWSIFVIANCSTLQLFNYWY